MELFLEKQKRGRKILKGHYQALRPFGCLLKANTMVYHSNLINELLKLNSKFYLLKR